MLAKSSPCKDLLSTHNLIESHLVPLAYEMEDAVIGALNRKRPRPNAAKRNYNKYAPPGKRANIAEQVSPLKTLSPLPPKADETNGTTSGADPTAPLPPAGLKHHLPDNRPEHLTPYINEFFRLVSKKNLEDFNGSTLGKLVGAMQFSAFHLGCMATYYKVKVGRYDRKIKEDIQSAKSKADVAEKKARDLNLENLKLIKQASLTEAKVITLKEELNKVKEDLHAQKTTYEN